MDPITIAALIATLSGAAIQYKASSDAQSRQRREIATSLAGQRELQLQAEKKALGTAAKFATPERQAEQSQIAEEIAQELIAPVSDSQAVRASQQTTQGAVSDDYKVAKASSDVQTLKAAEQLARMMGKTASSNRLRMNEGIRLMDTGQEIGTLGGFSRGQQGADQIAIQQAGNIDPGMQFAGSALSAAGSAGMAYGSSAAGANGLKPLQAMDVATGAPVAVSNAAAWQKALAAMSAMSATQGMRR